MDRIVEGTYTSTDEAVKAVERLLNEGYVAEELLIITDEKHEDELEKLTLVDVESVEEDDEEEESLWDKIKETFRMGDYSKENESNTLVEHGVDAETAEHFSESLENHEIIILMNSTAPEHSNQLSTVNEEVLNTDDSILETNDSKNALSEEQLKPSEIKTKESMNPASGDGEPFDPSKSQSAREDVPGTSTISSPDRDLEQDRDHTNDEEMFKKERTETTGFIEDNGKDMFNQDRHDAPHLTGDEKSVNAEDSNHVYPDNISTGVVGDELAGDSSFDREPRKVEHPEPHKDIPESDAYYSNKYEDAGGKTIRDEEEK
ncbi:general stress protein [Carnobacterium sp.]|uniref:general stress protein n=1 Tax=Carnobacterium sp. TaxID=48221 RepID=UPI003C73DCAB